MLTTSAPSIERTPSGGRCEAAAVRRLRDDGPNTVESAAAHRVAGRIVGQLADPLVALLLVAAVVTTALGDYPDTAVIALVVLVNTAIGVWQEIRADRAIASLDRLAASTARVVRDGVDRVVPASAVVRSARVRLAAGDIVPADIVLSEAKNEPTTNCPGQIVVTAEPTSSTMPAYSWPIGRGPSSASTPW